MGQKLLGIYTIIVVKRGRTQANLASQALASTSAFVGSSKLRDNYKRVRGDNLSLEGSQGSFDKQATPAVTPNRHSWQANALFKEYDSDLLPTPDHVTLH